MSSTNEVYQRYQERVKDVHCSGPLQEPSNLKEKCLQKERPVNCNMELEIISNLPPCLKDWMETQLITGRGKQVIDL